MGIAGQRSQEYSNDAGKGPAATPELLLIGASHKTADIDFREKLAAGAKSERLLDSLGPSEELAVLSTCNRFELYVATRDPDLSASVFLSRVRSITGFEGAKDPFYLARGPHAVRHLFRVATGLESVVVGEPQILAQVRAAGIGSRKDGRAGAILAAMFDRAYRVGTRVRAAYSFESEEASLSDLAVDAVEELSPASRNVMLIGTGKMVRLAAKRLRGGGRKIFVVTRRRRAPRGLEGAALVPYSRLRETAARCDVIISATSSTRPVLGKGDLGGRRKRLVVDLGMPRNVSPESRDLPNVRLVDLDDLARSAATRRPPPALKEAELATEREADAFYDWLVQTRLSSTLGDLYYWADTIRADELRRALGRVKLPSGRDRRVFESMGRRIVSKILARPTRFARKKHDSLTEEEKLDLLRSVFEVGRQDGR